MRIPFLFALLSFFFCDARITGTDYEIYPATIWHLSDGTYRVRIRDLWQEPELTIGTHDFICENLRHSDDCHCIDHNHPTDKQ